LLCAVADAAAAFMIMSRPVTNAELEMGNSADRLEVHPRFYSQYQSQSEIFSVVSVVKLLRSQWKCMAEKQR